MAIFLPIFKKKCTKLKSNKQNVKKLRTSSSTFVKHLKTISYEKSKQFFFRF